MDYHVPSMGSTQPVRWQAWFWRSWFQLIMMAIATNLVGLALKNLLGWIWRSLWFNHQLPKRGFWQGMGSGLYDTYFSTGLLMGLFLGFWISAFTSLVLRKKRPQCYQGLWFVLHYMLGALVAVVGFGWLINTYIVKLDDLRLQLLFEMPILSFIVASGLVGWQMQRWLEPRQH